MFNSIIEEIKKSCQIFFSETIFSLNPKPFNRFIISGNYLTRAINNYGNKAEPISVLKWFDDFWVYLEINFIKVEIETKLREGINKQDYLNRLSESLLIIEKDYYETTITLSLFQGDDGDDKKSQLFRAEWDNRLNNGTHPQPHWHIWPDFSFIESFNQFLEMIDERTGFADMIADMIDEQKSKCIDLSRIHFAMNAQWITKGDHFHKISRENALENWFRGLLGHIKCELEYVK